MLTASDRMDAAHPLVKSANDVIWRFQIGPTLHLGMSAAGLVVWQKSAVTGAGRLKPFWLHVATRIDNGRLWAELDPTDTRDAAGFLERALSQAEVLGGTPGTIVFPRELVRTEPRLLQVAADAGVVAAFASNHFKQRQKISRHFEEFLTDQISAHSLLAQRDNLLACRLV